MASTRFDEQDRACTYALDVGQVERGSREECDPCWRVGIAHLHIEIRNDASVDTDRVTFRAGAEKILEVIDPLIDEIER